MSESNRVEVSYIEEVTWNIVPATAFTAMRRTGGGLTLGQGTNESQEVRADRQVAGYKRTSREPAGTFDLEFSAQSHDTFMEHALATTWTAAFNTLAGSLTVTVGAGPTVTMTGAFTSLAVGDWFEIRNSVANDGHFKIAVATDNDNVDVVSWQTGITGDTAQAGCDIVHGGQLTPGVLQKSMAIQEEFGGLVGDQEWIMASGCRVGGMTLTIGTDAILTGSIDVLGGDVVNKTATSGYGDGTVDAAGTDPIMAAVDNVLSIQEGTVEANTYDTSQITITFDNGLRANRAVGNVNPIAVQYGTFRVTGNFSSYFRDDTLIAKVIAFTDTRLSFAVRSDQGTSPDMASYVFDLPRLNYSGELPDPSGLDSDIMQSLDFTATMDATEMVSVRITRFAETPA